MAMSAEHRSKFAAPRRKWRRLQMSEKFSSVTKKKPKQTKNIFYPVLIFDFSHLIAGNHLIFYEWTIKINQAKYFQSWGLIQCDGLRWNAAKHSHFDIVFQTNTSIIEWWKTTWLLEYYWTCRKIYMYCNKACFSVLFNNIGLDNDLYASEICLNAINVYFHKWKTQGHICYDYYIKIKQIISWLLRIKSTLHHK